VQQVDGYEATIVSGVVSRRNGRDTGARAGRLVRGVQSAPAAKASAAAAG
jgi:N-acyl-D-aspartate/D-glutamate deacylase